MESDRRSTIRKQIEYYLSDANLERDSFFHNLISTSKNESIGIDYFLKCKKIEELKATPKEIVEAIAGSTLVEGTEADGVRRKSSKPLPVLKARKQVQTNENSASGANNAERDSKRFEYLVYDLIPSGDIAEKARDLQSKVSVLLGFEIPLLRATKREGNIVLNRLTATPEQKQKVKSGFELGGIKYTTKELVTTPDIENFYKKHKHHVDKILKTKGFNFGPRKEKRNQANKGEVTFNGHKYPDSSKVKLLFKNLMAKTPNGAIISEPGHSQVHFLSSIHSTSQFPRSTALSLIEIGSF